MEKKSNRQNKTFLKYGSLKVAKYLQENEFNYTFQEKHNLIKCRMNDIDVKANSSWKYKKLNCMALKHNSKCFAVNHCQTRTLKLVTFHNTMICLVIKQKNISTQVGYYVKT